MKVKQRWTKSKALLGKGSTQQERAPPLDWDWLAWQFRELEEGDSGRRLKVTSFFGSSQATQYKYDYWTLRYPSI